jgi:hypothetical protein
MIHWEACCRANGTTNAPISNRLDSSLPQTQSNPMVLLELFRDQFERDFASETDCDPRHRPLHLLSRHLRVDDSDRHC